MRQSHRITADSRSARCSELNAAGANRLQAGGIDALEKLKQRLLRESSEGSADSATLAGLRRAAEEAASLAWITPFPLLVLPELFFEKATEAGLRSKRQQEILERSQGLIALAE